MAARKNWIMVLLNNGDRREVSNQHDAAIAISQLTRDAKTKGTPVKERHVTVLFHMGRKQGWKAIIADVAPGYARAKVLGEPMPDYRRQT